MARSKNQPEPASAPTSPWPHRMAWALACTTFPLIWMGGLVTTAGAGMAVPDWPNTYGYNLFLYPLESWWTVVDVRLEHSHRLIGATVGLLAIALAGLLWRCDSRRWMKILGLVSVVGVSLQGTLGGLRVIGSEIVLANIHGCTAPLYFTFCVALVTFTSPAWFAAERSKSKRAPRRLGLVVAAAIYLQIVLGAQMRHLPSQADPGWFTLWVWLHVILATIVLAGGGWLWLAVSRRVGEMPILVRRARLLAVLLIVQVLFGLLTWIVNYGWPVWFTENIWAVDYTIVWGGWWQMIVTTAHVGIGSLCLAASVTLVIWMRRLEGPVAASRGGRS